MGITEWVAVLVIFAVVYCLIKRYETRLVLIGSGLLLCLISWNLVGGLNELRLVGVASLELVDHPLRVTHDASK